MSPPKAQSRKRKRGMLKDRNLQRMMYGYGDDLNPLPETVALVEEIVVEYVTDLDLPKVNRCKQVLAMMKEVKQATRVMPMVD